MKVVHYDTHKIRGLWIKLRKLKSNDILQFIISNGIIDINDVRNCMEDMKKEELLKQHPYEIWQSKDGKWYTYSPAQGGGRALKKRKSKKT